MREIIKSDSILQFLAGSIDVHYDTLYNIDRIQVGRVCPVKSIARFVGIAVLFEIVALVISRFYHISWILDILIVLFVLYLAFLAARGWRRQASIQMPDILQAKTVRKRHWHLF